MKGFIMNKTLILFFLFMFSKLYASDPIETLIGGRPVGVGDYPEVVRIMSCKNGQCASCTASIIGPRTVLTAGHCMYNDEKKISFQFEKNIYNAQCENHPFYPDIEDMDMSLCKTDRPIKVKYAHISKRAVKIKEKVTLIGYGCLQEKQPRGGNDGILRVGSSIVTQLPSENPVNNWFYTRSSTALCFGDSGGPTYKYVSSPKKQTHYVVGINSRGNIRDLSLLTAIYLEKSISFIEAFMQKHNLIVCGMSENEICKVEKNKNDNDKNKCNREEKKTIYYEKKLLKWEIKLNECLNQ